MADPKKTETEKAFPVKLLKNLRPAGKFKVKRTDKITGEEKFEEPIGEQEVMEGGKITAVATGDYAKVFKGNTILLPLDEAKYVIEKKIAERADEIAA